MLRIKQELEKCIHNMKGDFVVDSTNYESKLCEITKWQCIDNRYYDAFDGESYIEIKKGQQGMWFNMIRYAEIFVKIGQQNTVTIFVRYNKKKKRVEEIFVIDTKEILDFLHMVPTKAACCIIMNKDSKRNLHMQAGATAKDMRKMASYIVSNPEYIMDKCIKLIKKFNRKTLRSSVCRKRKNGS
jgi:hypothetical protein